MKRVALLLSILSLAAAPSQAQWSTGALSQARGFAGAATVGNYALFAGGALSSGQSDRVDIYDSALGAPSNPLAWSTKMLTVKRRYVAATTVGQYALFAGGWVQGGGDSAVVDVFDAQTMTWSTATLSQPRKLIAATSVGTKALFAGGAVGPLFSSPIPTDTVDIYDSALGAPSNPLAWSTTTLTQARFYMAATTAGNQAIFAGGTDYAVAVYDTVDIYDDSTGMWSTASLSLQRAQLAATSLGTKAYFGGGADTPTTYSGVVDVYDSQTGAWSLAAPLSQPRAELIATSLGDQALFAGGVFDPLIGTTSNVVDILNTGSGWSTAVLSQARFGIAATTVDGKAMFAGGISVLSSAGPSTVIDIYEPCSTPAVYCTAKTSSSGCTPGMGSSGSASLSAPGGFAALGTQLEDNKNGLMFFGTTGQSNAPFLGGTLCVGAPLHRLLPKNTGGAGACSGALSYTLIEMLAQPSGGSLLVAGQAVDIQTWFRDPSDPFTVGLTNGMEFQLCP